MRILLALGLLPMLGCLALSTSQPDAGAAAATAGDSGVTGDGASEGVGCGTDQQTGVTLCLGTNFCPGATIDSTAFPGCGFREGSTSALDLECLCPGPALCPIGVPTSCDSVAQLLMQQGSTLQVCQQVSTGSCQALGGSGSSSGATSSSGSGSSSGATLSGACQACLSSCGTTPACYQTCGC